MAAEDAISSSKEKLGSMLAPIAGGVGADVSYDEGFEALKNEVDKLQSLDGMKPDWGSVASNADEILSDKSKDFRVAIYYAAAKSQLDGIGGLLDGLVLVRELTTAFWEPMYPPLKRPKARGNLIGWYSDVAAPAVEAFKPTTKDADVAAALDEVSRAVDADLREKLGEAYGGMDALRSAIRNLAQRVPQEAAPPPPRAEPAAGEAAPAQQVVSSGPSVASITDADSAMSVISECTLLLSRAGDALRTADPGNPLAYRFGRTGSWLELNQVPTADGGATLVPPPPGGLKEGFESLAAAENWMGLITAADEAAAAYILWLDPHRYIANAMDRLGAIFINAKKALLREVGILLLRVPTLPNLAFNDGTPFADGQTKMWLDAEVAPALGGRAAAAGGGGGAASALDEPIKEARALAASGKLDEAIALVATASATAPTGADRFRGKLALAKLCLQAEQFAIARAQLEGLDRVVVEHRLAEWEPELCADMYASLYAAHRGANRGDEVPAEARAREAAAFERLCQLDASAALKIAAG